MLHQYMYDTDTDTQHTSALGIITAMLTLTTRKLESKFHRCYSLRSSMIARHVPDLRTTVDLKPICMSEKSQTDCSGSYLFTSHHKPVIFCLAYSRQPKFTQSIVIHHKHAMAYMHCQAVESSQGGI